MGEGEGREREREKDRERECVYARVCARVCEETSTETNTDREHDTLKRHVGLQGEYDTVFCSFLSWVVTTLVRFLPYSLSVASIFDDYVCWERYCNLKLGRECHNIQSPHNGMYTKHQFYSDVSIINSRK